jgi:receptor protein-tyrosine kinase
MSIDEHLVTLLRRPAPELEDYNALRCALEEQGVSEGVRTIAVSSPIVGDGKTTTAINLAGVLAHGGARVLLIDGDLRRPSMAAQLGLPAGARAGLAEAITHPGIVLADVVTRLPECGLDVVVPTAPLDDPFELLRSPSLPRLIDEARQQYDMVVIDTAPLLLVPDARVIEGFVDGTVLVIAAHRTPRKLTAQALNLLDPSKLLGVVLNRQARQPGGYGYGSYGYGSYTSRRPDVRTDRDRAQWAAS